MILMPSSSSKNQWIWKIQQRFTGAKVWNKIDEQIKNENISNQFDFKNALNSDLLDSYAKLE